MVITLNFFISWKVTFRLRQKFRHTLTELLGTTAKGTMTSQEPVRQQPEPPGPTGFTALHRAFLGSEPRSPCRGSEFTVSRIRPYSGSPSLLASALWETFLEFKSPHYPQRHRLDWCMDFPSGSAGKESTCNAGDPGSIPGRSHGERIGYPRQYSWTFLVAQLVKNPLQCRRPAFDPCREDPLEEGMATHSSISCLENPHGGL